MRDMMTEIRAPYNERSITKVEKYDNGNFQCSTKSNYEISVFKIVSYGLESIRFSDPKIWKLISDPDELKELKSLGLFKEKSKSFEF